MGKQYRSKALAAVHETAAGLRDAGAIDKRTMRDFDELCLTPAGSCRRRRSAGFVCVSRRARRSSLATST
jgi:hypothetical protein